MKQMKKAIVVLGLATFVATMGMMGDGCTGRDFSSLAGVWSIERGDLSAKFTYTVNNGGEVTEESVSGALEPLDPSKFPPVLAELIAQWNAGLAELNQKIDEAIPETVIITFPGPFQMRITNADDPGKTGIGLINENAEYGFVAILGGSGQGSDQGGGGVLDVSSIEGRFNVGARTTNGRIVRRLIVALIGSNDSSLSFVAEISVEYTGQWIAPVPPGNNNNNDNDNENSNDNSNQNDNSNDNANSNEP